MPKSALGFVAVIVSSIARVRGDCYARDGTMIAAPYRHLITTSDNNQASLRESHDTTMVLS